MNFSEFHRYELDATKKTPFEYWASKVERILRHDLDGDQQTDGYSLDFAFRAFERGLSPQQYINSINREVNA